MNKKCALLSFFMAMAVLCPLSALVNPHTMASITSIPCEGEDEDFGNYTNSWAWAWLYAIYNPQTQKYSNIQHDWNHTLEQGYTYQVWEIYSNDSEYPSTTTQILVFIDYWRSDALARVQFEPF